MGVIFGFQEVLVIVKTVQELGEGTTKVQRALHRESKKKDFKALFLIRQCVGFANFEKISSANSIKAAWNILNKSYGGADKIKKVKLQSLRRQYELLSMADQELVGDYFNRIQVLVNSKKACDEMFLDQQLIEKVSSTLAPQFYHVVLAMEESKDLKKMKVEEVQNSLEAHEQKLLERSAERAAIRLCKHKHLEEMMVGVEKTRENGRTKKDSGEGSSRLSNQKF